MSIILQLVLSRRRNLIALVDHQYRSPLGGVGIMAGCIGSDFGLLLAQVVLLAVTRLRGRIYAKRHNGETLQSALESGNSALAIRYMGHLLSAALGVKAASGLVAYQPLALVSLVFTWLLVALLITAAISALPHLPGMPYCLRSMWLKRWMCSRILALHASRLRSLLPLG